MSKKTKEVFAKKEEDDVSRFFKKIGNLPESKRKYGVGKYLKIVNAIANTTKKENYKIQLNELGVPLKTAYPSLIKAIARVAKDNGVDFNKKKIRDVQTKNGLKKYVSYPEFDEWKKSNMRVTVVNNELYIEKLTDMKL